MSAHTARGLPTVYQDRAGISLYDAQWGVGAEVKTAIPDATIEAVVAAFLRFKRVCQDFGVPDAQVRVLATEATRVAINSDDFRAALEKATTWKVELLPKEEEGRIGAMGVASSFESVKGLVMDLGGGSTQLTWLVVKDGQVKMHDQGSVSMPYGAAALSRRLAKATDRKAKAALRKEITGALDEAVRSLQLPPELKEMAASKSGLPLYLSGGGFRGWGFMLMSRHAVSPYPIPIINGFQTSKREFEETHEVTEAAARVATNEDKFFRVSERRAAQIPAVALLISCLMDTLPAIEHVHFCQGGVREGALFKMLEPAVRAEHSFVAMTKAKAAQSTESLLRMLRSALPAGVPEDLSGSLLRAFVQSMNLHGALYKDLRAASALRLTTTGELAGIHGVSHHDRAALAIMLCERWGGADATAPSDQDFHLRLQQLLRPKSTWWCLFIGRIGAVLGELYPAGVVRDETKAAQVNGSWESRRKKHGSGAVEEILVHIQLSLDSEGAMTIEGLQKAVKNVEKIGKKKRWPEGVGNKVSVEVVGLDGETVPSMAVGHGDDGEDKEE